MSVAENIEAEQWFVLRDLKRPNALVRAYDELSRLGFEVFTPLKTIIEQRGNTRIKRSKPIIADLLFVHSTRSALDVVVSRSKTLQYRYVRGAAYQTVMTVDARRMTEFLQITKYSKKAEYYTPNEINKEMLGKKIRLIGGDLDGVTGNLMAVRGSRKRQLLINLDNIIAASVLIDTEFEVIDN